MDEQERPQRRERRSEHKKSVRCTPAPLHRLRPIIGPLTQGLQRGISRTTHHTPVGILKREPTTLSMSMSIVIVQSKLRILRPRASKNLSCTPWWLTAKASASFCTADTLIRHRSPRASLTLASFATYPTFLPPHFWPCVNPVPEVRPNGCHQNEAHLALTRKAG